MDEVASAAILEVMRFDNTVDAGDDRSVDVGNVETVGVNELAGAEVAKVVEVVEKKVLENLLNQPSNKEVNVSLLISKLGKLQKLSATVDRVRIVYGNTNATSSASIAVVIIVDDFLRVTIRIKQTIGLLCINMSNYAL